MKPGTAANREIRYYQREEGIYLSKATIERNLREKMDEILQADDFINADERSKYKIGSDVATVASFAI